jgi:hypothetical protein
VSHPLCRPPKGVGKPDGAKYGDDKPFRLGDDGRWRPDNGVAARAFLGKLDGENVAFIADCRCPYTNGCPLGLALTKADDLGISATMVHRRTPIGIGTIASRGATRKVLKRKKKR